MRVVSRYMRITRRSNIHRATLQTLRTSHGLPETGTWHLWGWIPQYSSGAGIL